MDEKTPRIILIATWSYFNKGDMLVLASTLDLVRKVFPNSRISIVAPDRESYAWASHNDKDFRGINVDPTPTRVKPFRNVRLGYSEQGRFIHRLFNGLPAPFWLTTSICLIPILYLSSEFRNTLRTLSQASLIIWCSGNLFFAPRRYCLHSTFEEMFTLFCCKVMLQKRIVFAPISFGPIQSTLTRSILKYLLNKVDYVLLREAASYKYAKAIGVTNKNIGISTDSAFLHEQGYPQGRSNSKETPLTIGVTPILPRSQGKEGMKHLELIASFLRKLLDKGNRIVFLTFSPIEGDSIAADYIASSLGNTKNVATYDLAYENSEELLKRVSEIDVLIAMRLHSVIATSLMGIPSIAIVEQKNKFWGTLRQLKMEDYALDIEALTEEDLELKFSLLIWDMDAVKARLQEIVPKMRKDATSLKHLLKAFLQYSMQPAKDSHPRHE